MDPEDDAAALLPEGWFDVYRWVRCLTPSAEAAEVLTVEVCRRLRAPRRRPQPEPAGVR